MLRSSLTSKISDAQGNVSMTFEENIHNLVGGIRRDITVKRTDKFHENSIINYCCSE